MIDQQIDIATKDGKTTTFITHPERGGPFPVIIFYMDAPAIREELRDMARRLATSGYYVMLPNMYYRSGVMELGPIPPDPEAPERKQMFGFMNSINIPMVMEDTKALLAYAETQEAANARIVGTVGYCMSGRYAVNAATHFPDRVKAAASIYGTHLATDQSDSPHLAASKTKAELYFACAETDIYAPQEIIDKVAGGMKGSNNEVEVAQDAFGLVAHDRIDLALDALGGAGGVVHQTADLVEKPVAGLGHLKNSPLRREWQGERQWRSRPRGSSPACGGSPCHVAVSLQSY